MSRKIRILAGSVEAQATLLDTPTARAIWEALPIVGRANTWGDEIYFSIPVAAAAEEDARADVEVGDLGYWISGQGLCIFFGPTPASVGAQPRAASPVNVFGRVDGDAAVFGTVGDGEEVRAERHSE